jgi:hypothetical protein
VAIASPPGNLLNSNRKKSNNASAIPLFATIVPINRNMGTADNSQLAANSIGERESNAKAGIIPINDARPAKPEMMSAKATGTRNMTSPKKRIIKIIA